MKLLLFAITLTFCFSLFAQQKITHTVLPKETFYGISKQYGVTIEQIKANNPQLESTGLKIGDVLIISKPSAVAIKTHEVLPKETMFGISRKYGVSQEKILEFNPKIKELGLQIGDVVYLNSQAPLQAELVNDDYEYIEIEPVVKAFDYTVKKAESIYDVSDNMRATIVQIFALNPDLRKNGLQAGQKLKYPDTNTINILLENYIAHIVKEGESVSSLSEFYQIPLEELISINSTLGRKTETETELEIGTLIKLAILDETIYKQAERARSKKDSVIDLVLLLPMNSATNEENKSEQKIALDFYLGAKLASEKMVSNGKKVTLRIIDSSKGQQSLISEIEKLDLSTIDAIVGPLHELNISSVINYLHKNSIPIVSPVVNGDRLLYTKNLIISEPREEDLIDNLIESVQNGFVENRVVVFAKDKNTDDVKSLVRKLNEKLKIKDTIEVYQNPTDFKLKSTASKDLEKILAINYTSNSEFGKNVMNHINNIDNSNIRAFGIGYIDFYNAFVKSNYSNLAFLTKLKFTYFTNHFINEFGSNEKAILKDFTDAYCISPNKYMATGYDVIYDLLDRMDENGSIRAWDESERRLSSKYNYIETQQGSIRNTGVRKIQF